MTALREIRFEPALERREVQFLESADLELRERLEGEIAERRPSPELERIAVVRAFDQALEAVEVELVWLHSQHVARRERLQTFGAEELAQPRDVAVQCRRC